MKNKLYRYVVSMAALLLVLVFAAPGYSSNRFNTVGDRGSSPAITYVRDGHWGHPYRHHRGYYRPYYWGHYRPYYSYGYRPYWYGWPGPYYSYYNPGFSLYFGF